MNDEHIITRTYGGECPACGDDGRKSLAQEIRAALASRGFWAPPNAADLITALGIALEGCAAAPTPNRRGDG